GKGLPTTSTSRRTGASTRRPRGYGRRGWRRRSYEGRVPSVTVSFTVLPLRVTLIVTVSPGLCALTLAVRSSAPEIALPSMAVTTSPALRPPLSAGEPLTTVVTCAPSFDVESPTRMPRYACWTLPPAIRVVATLFAALIGIAKPTPSLPPESLSICAFTPITAPLASRSGPPELRGLIAASG